MNLIVVPTQLIVPLSFFTERLLLRCPLPGDEAAYFAAVQESLDELSPWFDMSSQATLAGCEAHLQNAQNRFLYHEAFEFLIFMRENDQFVGRTGLNVEDWDTPNFEMGYWIRSSCSGHGLMTEAVKGLTRFALQELKANRVAIFCNEQNVKSAALAKRAGYRFEGILHNDRRHFRTRELVNACVFAYTPDLDK